MSQLKLGNNTHTNNIIDRWIGRLNSFVEWKKSCKLNLLFYLCIMCLLSFFLYLFFLKQVTGENDGYREQSPTNGRECKGGWNTVFILLGTEK